MGSFSTLLVENFGLDSTKNAINPEVMTIFQETDRQIYEKKVSDIHHSIPASLLDKILNDDTEGITKELEEVTTQIEYIVSVARAKERLNLLGFTLENAKKDFEIGVENEINNLSPLAELWEKRDSKSKSKIDKDFLRTFNGKITFLQKTTFEDWINAFKQIFQENIFDLKYFPQNKNPTIKYILNKQSYEEISTNYPFNADFRYFLRTFLEACSDEDSLVYDLTDLINGGWLSLDDNIREQAIDELIIDYPINSKIIVLTEGSTDKFILEKSLSLLYPHLLDYYSFMDFGLSNIAGGAGTLVGNVKAFASAGIANRIIAIFDNDTAAHVAVKGLNKTKIPENIKVLHYPELKLANKYPTIGPTGISKVNVNGLACSLELYFGQDTLIQNNNLIPIQWKGYDESLKKYQGEVLHKKDLQDRFLEKLEIYKKDSSKINDFDWTGIDLILQTIFKAFT